MKKAVSIAYASDLHFEFRRSNPSWLPDFPKGAGVLVLAGDIDVGGTVIDTVSRISDPLPVLMLFTWRENTNTTISVLIICWSDLRDHLKITQKYTF